MIDKINFMETLRSVAELTKTSNTPLSKEEVMSYFSEMELTKEQQDMVYQYLLQPHDEEELTKEPETTEETDEKMEANLTDNEPQEESSFFKMYQEDVNELPTVSKEEEKRYYLRLTEGDASVIQPLADAWLSRVLSIAKDYSIHKVNMEDLVQEGNIGLLSGLSHLLGNTKMAEKEEFIKESIQKAMEDFIDEMMEEQDWESTVVAKATLIHEAQKALAEDLGHVPTKQELSDYTKIPAEEIEDIMELSKEDEKTK